MNMKERIEKMEELFLRKEAFHSKDTFGREKYEDPEDFRTCYMIDRDRIIHSKSFRRLKHKTQVYIKTHGDHFRTRLTHTLEVSQIGRTIARGLAVNEDLVEAITIGHDIGHVAFAHIGEDVLNKILPGGFRHYEQSVRVLTKLEKEGKGLNLSKEVLDGVLEHSGFGNKVKEGTTLESQISKYADKIAYVNHDIDDAVRAGELNLDDVPKEFREILGDRNSQRVNTLVRDLVENTEKNLEKGILEVSLSQEKHKALIGLRKFMFQNIYLGPQQVEVRKKAEFVVGKLYEYYYSHCEELPSIYKKVLNEEGKERAVADYIAGMTDDYAIAKFNELFVPRYVF